FIGHPATLTSLPMNAPTNLPRQRLLAPPALPSSSLPSSAINPFPPASPPPVSTISPPWFTCGRPVGRTPLVFLISNASTSLYLPSPSLSSSAILTAPPPPGSFNYGPIISPSTSTSSAFDALSLLYTLTARASPSRRHTTS
ncbi:hypothetical protein H0H92_013138, partial [Tricholoma furcatifolium]